MSMSPETKRAIDTAARRSARAAVKETLLTLGIDASTGSAVQEVQKDMSALRRFRLVSEARGPRVVLIVFSTLMTVVGAVATFVIQKAMGQ